MRARIPLLVVGTLLVASPACYNYGPTDANGDLVIVTHLSAGTPDPDGYTVAVSGHGSVPIGVADTVVFGNLPIGNYTVTLSGFTAGCTVTDGAAQAIYVPVGVKTFDFFVTCP